MVGRKPSVRVIVAVALLALAVSAPRATAQTTGLQVSLDGMQRFVNKDVGNERWAIALNNDDGTVTGNVFYRDGRDPSFIVCEPLAEPNQFACSGANSCAPAGTGPARGIQTSPDTNRTLVNKDVGNQRWAITLNVARGGTVTGNVFFPDDSEPQFVFCEPLGAPNSYRCSGAGSCNTVTCTEQYNLIGDVTLPSEFFQLPGSTHACSLQYQFISNVELPAGFFGETSIEQTIEKVETSEAGAQLSVGLAPLPTVDTQTVDDDFDFSAQGVGTTPPNSNVIAGGSNVLSVDFNATAVAALAADSLATAAGSGSSLIIAVRRPDGTFARGYFELPLGALTGEELLTSVFSQQLGNQPFDLAFATRTGNHVSQYTIFPLSVVPVTSSGLTISLSIYPSQDLDLFLLEPGQSKRICLRGNGCNQISPTGGILDLDANRQCAFNVGVNNEHITYPGVTPPAGDYEVAVGFFQDCLGTGAAYTVVVSNGVTSLVTDGFFFPFEESPGTARVVQRFTFFPAP